MARHRHAALQVPVGVERAPRHRACRAQAARGRRVGGDAEAALREAAPEGLAGGLEAEMVAGLRERG